MSFVHLQNHSEYSMLQSSIRTAKLVSQTKAHGQTSVALTDNGNMFGILEFYFNAKKEGLNPILGCHLYVTHEDPNKLSTHATAVIYDRLVLIAKNDAGYQNLLKLVSHGHIEGFNQHPLVPIALVKQHTEGLFAFTGSKETLIGASLLLDKTDRAQQLIDTYTTAFDGHFYLNLQNHGLVDELTLNKKLAAVSQEQNIPLVASNDTHYTVKEDAKAHRVLRCIEKGMILDEFVDDFFTVEEYHVKSTEEMEQLFIDYPEAIENTSIIADQCHVDIRTDRGDEFWPKFEFPEGFDDSDDYLAHITWSKLDSRYPVVTPEVKERIQLELDIMKEMKVSGYMLITQDFINWAREHDIPVGPGRGSAVGSAVCYTIGITDLEPMQFDLLFERFLNPERVSMPDIDTDFSDKERQDVINYVIKKYKAPNVSQLVTYSKLKAKAVLHDVGRALNIPFDERKEISDMIPPLGFDLTKALEKGDDKDDLDALINKNDQMRQLWAYALKLEGLTRQTGIHAAAVIIAPKPLVELAPLYKAPGEDDVVIQYDKTYAEDVGFLKMDFLGLRTLSVIKEAVAAIKENHNVFVDVNHLDLRDPTTYTLLGKGLTVGVFQFESEGMQEYLKRLKPTCLEDMIAMNALYRPGPIEQIPHFIARKQGTEDVDCYHEDFESILGETYGVIVYQEQVMRLAQTLCGFSLGKADIMRRIMAKKKPKEMDKLYPEYIEGAISKGYTKELAENIWEVLLPFCAYAFNKSHSAAYGYVAFQSAYLKAHHAPECMTAIMNSEIDKTERIVVFIEECKQLGVNILPPDVNQSISYFKANPDGTIRYGLGGIKNVGISLIDELVKERNENGPFESLFDLCKRFPKKFNKRSLECMIMAGALDHFPGTRAELYASVDTALEYASRLQKDKEMGQVSLFDMGDDPTAGFENSEPKLESVDPWSYIELLEKEKQVLGVYFSGHPLEDYKMELEGFTTSNLDPDNLADLPIPPKPDWKDRNKKTTEHNITIGGIVTSFRAIPTKDSRAFGIVTIQDVVGTFEAVFWADEFEVVKDYINLDAMLLIEGRLEKRRDTEALQLVGESVIPMEDARSQLTRCIHVQISTLTIDNDTIRDLEMVTEDFESTMPNACDFILHVETNSQKIHTLISKKNKVSSEKDFIDELVEMVGEKNVWLSASV
ncbi:MAG: DNA polymerase III subunit alpha [Fibrobacterales bacterium]